MHKDKLLEELHDCIDTLNEHELCEWFYKSNKSAMDAHGKVIRVQISNFMDKLANQPTIKKEEPSPFKIVWPREKLIRFLRTLCLETNQKRFSLQFRNHKTIDDMNTEELEDIVGNLISSGEFSASDVENA